MPKRSAGLLVYRKRDGALEVLLVHPGGPFWAKRDDGAWSIPKGEIADAEEPIAVATREFEEELGIAAPARPLTSLGSVRQAGGKVVEVWSVEGDVEVGRITSNTFEMEWPLRSGRTQKFPEVDRAAWFDLPSARRKVVAAQSAFLDRLEAMQ